MNKLRLLIPLSFLFVGLFYFFEPFLSSVFEIINSNFARKFFLPIDWLIVITFLLPFFMVFGDNARFVPDIIFLAIFLLYLFYFVKVIRYNWPNIYKKLAILPIIIFILIWVIMLPVGFSYFERGANAYPIGGNIRLMQAGGQEIIKVEAIEFMENNSESSPPKSEWPPSIQKLGSWVRIEHKNKLVLVGIGRMFNMANEFGFIIQTQSGPRPKPQYLEVSDNYEILELADGIYFFERP